MTSNSAISVEVTRGSFVESSHLVDAIVADNSGAIVSVWGQGDLEIFPRSAIKALQALPLVESGAAQAFGFEPKHIALACASHNGEPMHTDGVAEMFEKMDQPATCLECGAQHPKRPQDIAALAKAGVDVSAIHNNCSGKHAGFIAFAAHQDIDCSGYIRIGHPVQKEIAATLEAITQSAHGKDNHAIDGCSIPTYRIPLASLATAFAKFGVGDDASKPRSNAMLAIRDACLAHPEMVAGKGRACTAIMNALGNRAFVKVGAEGVYTAALPELGYGIALKSRDGEFRAAEVAISQIICNLLELSDEERAKMTALTKPVLKNWNGIEVGKLSAKLG